MPGEGVIGNDRIGSPIRLTAGQGPDGPRSLGACSTPQVAARDAAPGPRPPPEVAAALRHAVALGRAGDLAAAERHAAEAARRSPDSAEAHSVLASVLAHQERLAEAVAAYERVVGLAPTDPIAHLLLANACLRAGAWPRGWAELEWRLALPEGNRRQVGPARRWRGEAVPGGTILVHAPDGAGDAIMFARYLPAVAARCARVVLAVEASLVTLLRQVPGVAAVVDEAGAWPAYDRFVDRLSLPWLFATTPATVPGAAGYLRADPDRVTAWAGRLLAGRKVGLAWSTHPGHPGHRERSVPVDALAPLLAIGGLVFVNLQVGPANADGARIGLTVNPASGLADYADTAAVMMNLDLVISVDTSVCHLAGALGVPVWTILPRPAEWRWMTRAEGTPWYRSMRLFRRAAGEADWDGVVARLAGAAALWACSTVIATDGGVDQAASHCLHG